MNEALSVAGAEFRWGLIGPGAIAHQFAEVVQRLPGSRLALVHGRDAGRAGAFAARWSVADRPPPRVARELSELLADPDIDAIYIATPHAQHGAAIRACLEAGKPVLCEKPLVPTLAEAEALVALARQRQVFLMEALWTRFLPAYAVAGRWLREQAIGPLRGIQSSFCFPAPYEAESRLFNPALAGGALLDLGVYNLNLTRWVLQQAWGDCPAPTSIDARGLLAPTGVDQRVNAMLTFEGGLSSQFICAFDSAADNALTVFGERGTITLPRWFSQASEAVLQRRGGEPQRVAAPLRINGFEGEIEEAQQCIAAGRLESAVMPHAETLAVLGWMDEIRRQLGVRYPFE
ncbi:Gfo/Idh/MocA family protein [Roseateles violae]|uniref:Gfo/Idh/MocA family oxidoreductase n=1 Tax=Roseateles violae TaxID=3058042 RepID=A0ABT8DQD9_9BURK|nr:Gfo/Idh/MocA family oxidoreductase [Pelomonas sp. PFR6]MDN3919260.1 Gfo/Idh/MocA family oxidoreductase [Pelomonas sp. PFR6]